MCTPHNRSKAATGNRDRNEEASPLETLTAGVVTLVVLGVAFGALALGQSWFWIAFPIGFGGLLPVSLGYVRRLESNHDGANTGGAARSNTSDSALAVLRDRYARDEIDEAELERRLEVLLETEMPHDAPRRPVVENGSSGGGARVP